MPDKVTTAIYLDTRREKKDYTYPVKLRVTHKRERKYYGLGNYSFTKDEFKRIYGDKPRGENKETRLRLNLEEQRATDIINSLPAFTFQQFEKLFSGNVASQDLTFAFDIRIEQLKRAGRVGTASTYKDAKKSINDSCLNRKLSFQDLTPGFLQKYERWMLSKGNSTTTVGFYLRCVRQLYNEAIKNGGANSGDYPFRRDKYKIPQPRNIKKALQLSDIAKLFKYKPAENSPEHFYRDLWLFSYLANGMNVKDMVMLKYGHIHGEYIHFRRAKTELTNRFSKPIDVYMTDEVKEIIERWGSRPVYHNNFIFPVLSLRMSPEQIQKRVKQTTKLINKYIKRIAASVEIEGNISTYTARHSFATVLKRSGASIEFISEQLGHSSVETTAAYLDSFEDEKKKEMAKELTKFKE
jgi:site-specific recombinase XerD